MFLNPKFNVLRVVLTSSGRYVEVSKHIIHLTCKERVTLQECLKHKVYIGDAREKRASMTRSWNSYLFTWVHSGTQSYVFKHFLARIQLRSSIPSYLLRFDYFSLFLEFGPLNGFFGTIMFSVRIFSLPIHDNIRVLIQRFSWRDKEDNY